MSPGWASVYVAVIAFLSSLVAAWVSSRATKRVAQNAQEVEILQVEAEAFRRARDSYTAALAEQEQRIGRLHTDVSELRGEVGRLRQGG